jgi:hypothetical protein
MGIFGQGRDDWELKNADEKVKKFLENLKFQIFSSDGQFFLDNDGNEYGAWGDLCHVERIERKRGGKIYYEITRGIRQLNPEKDVFQLVHDYSQCWIGKMHYWDAFNFLNRCPLQTYYNAAVVTPVATWREDGFDGGGQKTLYSLLMLQTRVRIDSRFVRDETPEEKRRREIENSMPLF